METYEQTARALEPEVRRFLWAISGQDEVWEFDHQWRRKNWRGRVDLCVYWLRRRTQAENNMAKVR